MNKLILLCVGIALVMGPISTARAYLLNENRDATNGGTDFPATGPKVSFLNSFVRSYEAKALAGSQHSIEYALQKTENEQEAILKKAGVKIVPVVTLNELEIARFWEDGGTPQQGIYLKQYDDQIIELRKRYPDLRLQTSFQLWEGVKLSAKEAERIEIETRHTFMGSVGDGLGYLFACMNPALNPLNTLAFLIVLVGFVAGYKHTRTKLGCRTGS